MRGGDIVLLPAKISFSLKTPTAKCPEGLNLNLYHSFDNDLDRVVSGPECRHLWLQTSVPAGIPRASILKHLKPALSTLIQYNEIKAIVSVFDLFINLCLEQA